jgi:hypothetical protein
MIKLLLLYHNNNNKKREFEQNKIKALILFVKTEKMSVMNRSI